jgi:uncharacterized protein (TIGR02996 family)
MAKHKHESGPEALRRALEDALAEDPDALANHLAYADFLMEQGDPRGEFIRVQLQLEDAGIKGQARKDLQKRERQLLRGHGTAWLGELAPDLDPNFTRLRFVRGWLDAVYLETLPLDVAEWLATVPQVRLLRRLVVDDLSDADDVDEDAEEDDDDSWPREPIALNSLAASSYLGNLRALCLGPDVGDVQEYLHDSLTDPVLGDDLIKLVKKLPRLEELRVAYDCTEARKLFALKTLRNLRILEYNHGSWYPLETLAANPALGNLQYLLLHPRSLSRGDDPDSPHIALDELRAVLRSKHLVNLTHLRVHQTVFGDAGCREVVASGILKRLQVLDLGHGAITDEGAWVLAECPDVTNLRRLVVSRNALTRRGVRLLRATGVDVEADEQHAPGDDAYLFEGDWE